MPMREITLTADQKTELETRHKQARDSRESDRINEVDPWVHFTLLTQGDTLFSQAASVLGSAD